MAALPPPPRQDMSARAIERLEQKGFLKHIRAEMKADVMQCLVDMEEAEEIPSKYRIKRFSPTQSDDQEAIKMIHQFLVHHGFTFTAACLKHEVNWPLPLQNVGERCSELARRIGIQSQLLEEEDQ
jgi:hypothetical protein